jgi:alkylresorcinol/alkylpyrone synthase
MPAQIVGIGTALPSNVHTQAEVTQMLAPRLAPTAGSRAVLERIHQATGIQQRHFALPINDYALLEDFTQSNTLFVEHALALAVQATRQALDDAGVSVDEVDHLFFTTVTGIGAPSLDVMLAAEMGFRKDIRRIPSFGLGCVAGAAGLARVNDYLAGHPTAVALVVSVELCSLTVQWDDRSMANFVGTGIFGDGAASVVLVGEGHSLATDAIEVSATRSALYPQTEDMIGWKIGASGLSLMLEAGVPEAIEQHFAADVDELLSSQNLTRSDVDVWLAHPGGPRILEAFTESLHLPPEALASSWEIMAQAGNMSSAAVLHVLAAERSQPVGTRGLLFALGPGMSAELVLLEWC